MKENFDISIIKRLREVINSSPIFSAGEHKAKYNLICAVMDRVETCIDYMSNHKQAPKTEEELIVYLVFGAMLRDAVFELYKAIFDRKPQSKDDRYFKKTYIESPIYNPEKEAPSDDHFFEYIRSLVFAHPTETSRAHFLKNGETQYSPWVIASDAIANLFGKVDYVGVRIYSNLCEEIISLRFPFSILVDYITSRYEILDSVIEWAESEIQRKKEEWSLQTIDRRLPPIDMLNRMCSILKERYQSTSDIQEISDHLTCPLTSDDNFSAVDEYRNALISFLPDLCDRIERQEELSKAAIFQVLNAQPQKIHEMASYQLEKIYTYLELHPEEEADTNYKWGRIQLKHFYDQFAKKWVYIDMNNMPAKEMLLLVHVSCYLEKTEQEKR